MEEIFTNLPVYMLIGIVAVVGASQVNRLVGAVLGVLFWAAVAVVGTAGYAAGGALGIGDLRLTQTMFYALCGTLAGFNVMMGYAALKRSRSVDGSSDYDYD